jgi:hypothetical protein
MDARYTHQLLLTKCEKVCNLFRILGPVHFREPLSVTPAISPPSLTSTDPFLSPRSLLAAAIRSAADSGPVIRVGFAPLRRTILGEARRSAAESRKVVRVRFAFLRRFRIGAGRRATTESRPGSSAGFAREEPDYGPGQLWLMARWSGSSLARVVWVTVLGLSWTRYRITSRVANT